MAKVYESASELVGKTPLLKLNKYQESVGVKDASILAKLEYLNPAGSVKDRVALQMIEDLEESGQIKPGATLIEPTSGNTGIGIAAVAASKGYKVVITIPETMSIERRNIIKAYGAEIVLTDGAKGMKGAIAKAEELKEATPGSVILGQFVNPSNPKVHRLTTGPEIWEDTDGKVDIFVAGVGTGGTVTGVGEYLKSKNPNVKIVAVEPKDSPVLSEGKAGAHKIQGIGAGFVPDVLNTEIYDEIIPVSNEDSFETGKAIAKTEGVLVGISSGAKLVVALVMVFCLGHAFTVSSVTLILAAFIGACLSMGFVLLISNRIGNMSSLIIGGVMIGYICTAVTDFVVTFADDADIVNLHNWSKGSFSGMTWNNVTVMSALVFVITVIIFCLAKPIGAYQLGESYAQSMGVNIRRFRVILVMLSSLLAACITAYAGPVSFVGIAVPHLVKNLFGTAKPIIMIPACFLGGSVF